MEEIFEKVLDILGKEVVKNENRFTKNYPHDVPGDWFKGPF